MAKIDLSIIIVSYNTQKLVDELLGSITAAKKGDYRIEIILVDNDSNDGSVAMVKKRYPQVKILVNQINLGFAAANNKGMRNAKGRLVLLLNSDTQVEKDTLVKMIDFIDTNSRYQAATCRVELADGRLDPACHRGFPSPWAAFSYFAKLEKVFPRSKIFGQYHQGWKDLTKVHQVEVISGAFFLVSRKIIEKVGLLDEGFFMYGEDVDWCLRIKKAGFRIGFAPNTKIIHVKGKSGRSKDSEQKEVKDQVTKHFWGAMKLFYKKHYTDQYPKPLMWLIIKIIDRKLK